MGVPRAGLLHPGGMTNAQPELPTVETTAARQAAYRRLAAYILGLDVATLAAELRAERDGRDERLPLAA
jgi:hypothetical protein